MMKTGLPGLRNKASQFTKWTEEIQAVASAARAQTEPFDDYEIAADLAKDGFRLSTMKKEPVTVYLIIPPEEMERHSKWLRLIVTAAFQSVLRVREPHEPKVLFMLDEFAALGHMQIIETVWALVRGYGIQILPVFQDLNQLKGIYKDRWETFIGMAGAALSFAPNDLTTAGWISARAGEKTACIQNTTSSDSTSGGHSPGGATSGWSISTTNSFTDTQVPFVRPHTLFGMKEGATLSFLAGLEHIVPGYAPPYWDIEECRVRARPNPYVAKSGNAPPGSVYIAERRDDKHSQYPSSGMRLSGFPEKLAIQWAPHSALQAYSSSDARFSVLGKKIADRL
jgi:type IV secretory pathway TraG/TraD family ATPase VirD4